MAQKKSMGSTPTGEYPHDAGRYGEPHFRPKTAKTYGPKRSEHRQGLTPSDYKRLPTKS